jgi:hypothetical protein
MFDGLVFLVSRPVANIQAGTCTLDLQSLDPACYSFDPGTEEGTAPVLPNGALPGQPIINNPNAPPAPPANLAVTVERRAVTGSSNATFLRLTATMPAGRTDLSLLGRYRQAGAGDWITMAPDTDDTFSLTSNVLQDGGKYEVEGAVSTYGQALVSDYVAATGSPITAVSDPTPPGKPFNLSASVTNGIVTLSWQDSDSPNVATYSFYRNGAIINLVTAGPNTTPSTTDNPGPGSYSYFVIDANTSGLESDPSNTASATVPSPTPPPTDPAST